MPDNKIPPEVIESWFKCPDKFAESWRLLKHPLQGKIRFSLEDWPWWRTPMRHFNRDARNILVVYKCSRKVAKSTNICNLFHYSHKMFPGIVFTYTTGKQETVSRFIKEVFKESVDTSVMDYFKYKYMGGTPTNQRFATEEKGLNTILYAYTAWGEAGALLGITGDFICVDECQDMGSNGWFAKVKEIMAMSPINWMVIAGTARDSGDDFDLLWKSTDQREWIVKCNHCGMNQTPYLNRDNTMAHDISNRQRKIETAYFGCKFCKEELSLENIKDGTWVTKKPGNLYIGYHMNQIMNPIIGARKVMEKMLDPNISRRDFDNEVIGVSWEGKARPLSMETIWANCVDYGKIENIPRFNKEKRHFMGIDWGEDNTIIIINKDREIVLATRISSKGFDDEVTQICNLIDDYCVETVIADQGFGARQIRELQNKYGDKVRGMLYSSLNEKVKYELWDKRANPIYLFTVDRTWFIDKILDYFETHQIRIPYWKDYTEYEWVLDELFNLKGDVEGEGNKIKYGRYGGDHACHAIGYANYALDECDRYREIKVVRISNK